eukprot:UN3152
MGKALAPDLYATCSVNSFAKRMMRRYLSDIKSGRPYSNNCQFLPQAEFFDMPHGAEVAVANRVFPKSMNKLLAEHGYNVAIRAEDADHVGFGCDHVWAGDLDSEAKALVRQVYGRDFELTCKHFGHCDTLENTCITGVPGMCPSQLFTWNGELMEYERK